MDTLYQAKSLIEKSRNILILPSSELQGDNLGSALALFFSLKKLGKNASLFIEKIPEKFQFLTDPRLASSKNFAISVNTLGKEISEIHYEKNTKDLKIYLALNKGEIKEEDVAFLPRLTNKGSAGEIDIEQITNGEDIASRNPDLLITLGASSLDSLGEPFNKSPRIFYENPILNIDNRPSNENFGEVNLIKITSSSLAEISTNLIKLMDSEEKELLDGYVATYLLTGIIWASKNFRSPRTQPKTLETASMLIEKGANHQKIIQHLYKQKGISQIKLLGRILEKLRFDEKKELYSAFLTGKDFQNCQAGSRDLSFVIEELRFNFRYLPNLLILWEGHASPPLIKGVFCSPRLDLIEKVLENFEGVSKGEGALFLIRDCDLDSAKEKVLKIL